MSLKLIANEVTMNIIEFKNITVLRNKTRILDGVDLTIVSGGNTAILGPNGSGKSTLIKLMTREIYPYNMEPNTFEVFGEKVWDVLALRGKLGIVSDSMAQLVNPDVTCFETVVSSFYNTTNMYDMTADKKATEKSMDSLEFMDVGHLKNRFISEVSTGEARRVLIARALAHNPKALMLDEPTNALDIAAVHKFRATMSKIAKNGVTVIIATHTLQDVIPEIKNIVMLKEGKIFLNAVKKQALTKKNLEGLFGIKVELSEDKGHYLMK